MALTLPRSGFFDPPWHKPVDGLREDYKGFVLNQAGYRLRALGRLAEAVQPLQAGFEADKVRKDWKNAARPASSLSQLYLTIGDVTQALAYAKQSVELADQSRDAFQRMSKRTTLADALHQAGRLAEAEATFREAEEMQKKDQPQFPLLYSVQGYQSCDLLLSQGKHAEVQRRASKTLEWAKQVAGVSLLDTATIYLSIGRAHLLQSQREPNHPSAEFTLRNEGLRTGSITQSPNFLNRAVDGLRQAGHQWMLPLGLLARAEFYRVTGALEKTQRDLDEAFAIATRGGMGLFVADCHLEYARLALARGGDVPPGRDVPPERLYGNDDAREHLAIAKKMIDKMGYHRRDEEVKELETRIS